MHFKKKQPVFDVGMENLISFSQFAGLIGNQGVFVQKLTKFILKKAFMERFVTDNGEILACFYGTGGRICAKNLFIDKRAIHYFVKKYEKELEQLGASSDALKTVIHHLPRVQAKTDGIMNLWQIMAKISVNTKCVSDLCQYVKDNFLDETYPVMASNGCISMEKSFVFAKGKAGRSGIAIKKDAVPYFLKRYQSVLKKEADRLDLNMPVISIRGLMRELNMMENKDLDLKNFIINHCMNDTFQLKTKEGEIQTLPCFYYTEERYLCIDKRGLHTFVSRYQKELKELGFKNFAHVLADKQKLAGRKDFYSLKDLQDLLYCFTLKDKITNYLNEKGVQALTYQTTTREEVPFFKEFYFKGQKSYYLPKNMLVAFLTQEKDLLESFGVRSEFILDRSGVQKIPLKNKDMIVFDDFYARLTTDSRFHKGLSEKLKTLFKDEVFEYQDEMGRLIQSPVFMKVRSGVGISTVFSNEQAMKSFVSKHRDFLIKHKIKKEAILNYLGEKAAINYTDEYVMLSDFPKIFHQSKKNMPRIIREKYLDETYTVLDENNVLVERPIFYPMQHEGKGMIFYGCKKEDLTRFARRHQEDLKISDLVLKELEGKITIPQKTDDYISIPDFFRGMSKSNRPAILQMNKFVVQNCMQDMYVTTNDAGALVTKPIFSYTRHKESGVTMLCIDVNGAPTLFKRRGPELKKLGIYPDVFIKKIKASKQTVKQAIMDKLRTLGRA